MSIVLFNMLFEMGPLGLLHLVTYLGQKGHPARCVFLSKLDPETPEELNAICSFVADTQPSLLGFSLMSFNFRRARRLTIELKQRFPHIPIVWGGIHPTMNPEESIRYADYVCVGEGEEALLDLVRAIDGGIPTDNIPNIWSKQNGQVINTPLRARAINDGIPVDDNDGYERPYGAYPNRYPYLFDLQRACDLTPRFLIKYFLHYRRSRIVRGMFDVYYRFVYKNADKARQTIMKNTALVHLTKKALFLPNTLVGCLKRISLPRQPI